VDALERLALRDVGRQPKCAPAARFDGCRSFVDGVLTSTNDHNVGASIGKPERQRAADSARPTRNDGCLP